MPSAIANGESGLSARTKINEGFTDITHGGPTNRIVRTADADAALQSSGVGLDASDNMTGVNDLTLDGDLDVSAGQGITFDSGSNYLDDYEEGTWTPAYSFGAGGPPTYAIQDGEYTKKGREVTVTGRIGISSLGGGSGSVDITGLPFTAITNANTVTGGGIVIWAIGLNITAGYNITALVGSASTSMTLRLWDSASGISTLQASEISSNGDIIFEVTYNV